MDWLHLYISGVALLVFGLVAFVHLASTKQVKLELDSGVFTYLKFIYASFLKPHDKSAEDQQDALESFYKTQVCLAIAIFFGITVNTHTAQASAYDATRRRLLRGREDMLGLVAAQLKHKVENKEIKSGKAVWVDVSSASGTLKHRERLMRICRSAVVLGRPSAVVMLGFSNFDD